LQKWVSNHLGEKSWINFYPPTYQTTAFSSNTKIGAECKGGKLGFDNLEDKD